MNIAFPEPPYLTLVGIDMDAHIKGFLLTRINFMPNMDK